MTPQNTGQAVPRGLRLARNILAATAAVALGLGLVTFDDPAGRVMLWIGVLCLIAATGFALATTRWATLPVATKILIVIAVAGAALVLVDVVNG